MWLSHYGVTSRLALLVIDVDGGFLMAASLALIGIIVAKVAHA